VWVAPPGRSAALGSPGPSGGSRRVGWPGSGCSGSAGYPGAVGWRRGAGVPWGGGSGGGLLPGGGVARGGGSGGQGGLLVSGGLVMLLGSGPTLLAVGLAAQLHGTRWVAGSALAFALGSLLAPVSVARLERRALPASIAWPALGGGMVAGWTFAASHPAALLAASSSPAPA
jgi:hypothetical protein